MTLPTWIDSLLTTCLIAAGATAQSPAAGNHRVFQFKTPVPLRMDVTRIALLPAEDDSLDALANSGIAEGSLEPLAIRRWSIAATPQAVSSEADIEGLVARIASAPGRLFVSPVFFDDLGGPLIVTSDILVGFDADVPVATAERILADVGSLTIVDRDWARMRGAYRVRSSARNGLDVLAHANELAQRNEILFAEPDFILSGRGTLIPNDPGFGDVWGLHNTGQAGGTPDVDMDAPEAWDITIGVDSILVAVIDTGAQQDHPDLHQVPGADMTGEGGGGGPVNACDVHGTAVAGCISATIDNATGTVGIAPGCRVASVRAFVSNASCNLSWSAPASWTVDALAWAESIGARVTNNSNIYGFGSAAIATKYAQTRADGMVHFACAGNSSAGTLAYPSSLPTVNAVAAITRTGVLAGFSNSGPGLDFSAPGVAVYTTDRTGAAGFAPGDYVSVDGTSFASPYAAGVAALVLSRNPGLSADQVEESMKQTATDLGAVQYDETYGYGLVNAFAALASFPGRAFCFGDGTGAACPCANTGTSGRGCRNIAFASGALLNAAGLASVSADTVVLACSAMSGNLSVYFQGTGQAADPFGYGINCLSGTLLRIGSELVVGGVSANPSGFALPISVSGSIPPAGGTRYYQTVYRQVVPACAPSPATLTNRTNGIEIVWMP